MERHVFGRYHEFLGRSLELEALEEWWADDEDPFPLVLLGRRRAGKTWLIHRFAHGKPADILGCVPSTQAAQLSSFAGAFEGRLGYRPAFPDVASLFRFLFHRARTERRLAVIDEFPELLRLGTNADAALAGVIETELPGSRLKLVICGSQVPAMEELLAARSPLRGRGRRLLLEPLPFRRARPFLGERRPADLVTRYAIAGGMPMYLQRLGRPASLRSIVCGDLLEPLGPFFNEPWDVLELELVAKAVHFSLLRALSRHPEMSWPELVASSRVSEGNASRNVRVLQDLHLVQAANPMFAEPNARQRRYRLTDHLMRFWFRFVFQSQESLRADVTPEEHYARSVAPHLDDHVRPVFEDLCRAWVRRGRSGEPVGRWWGPARRRASRTTEEIDVVAGEDRHASWVGECAWTGRKMRRAVLDDLLAYKLPALAQGGVDVREARIALFSRAGFAADLEATARERRVELVDVERLVNDLPAA